MWSAAVLFIFHQQKNCHPERSRGTCFSLPPSARTIQSTYSPRRPALPELRKDPITGRWVIISTDRGKRPSDFLRESVLVTGPKNCPFCPGAESKTPPEILVYGRNGS